MNYYNNNKGDANSWGTFISRHDQQSKNQNFGNTPFYVLNKQQNLSIGYNSQNHQNSRTSDASSYFHNSVEAHASGGTFNANECYSNQGELSFGHCGNLSYDISQQTPRNDNNYNQNRWNSNNSGKQNFQSKTENTTNLTNDKSSSFYGPGNGSLYNESFDNGNNLKNQNTLSSNNSSSYVSYKKFKQHFSNRPNIKPNNDTPAPTLFMGRDQSYPDELNTLMNPFFCGVCNARLNSIKSANIHYESRAHDKHITNWLKKHYADKGLTVPEIHRFVAEETNGPYRCELCKLDLTSAQHALQHYNGKRHKQAASKISRPTGIGYYNVDGNWVETGKVFDNVTGKETSYILVNIPSGTEPVVLHVASNTVAGVKRPSEQNINSSEDSLTKKPNLVNQQHDAQKDKTNKIIDKDFEKKKEKQNASNSQTNNQLSSVSSDSEKSSSTNQTPQEALNSQQCKICGISTTSYDQMILHLKGSRHTKKLRALGEPPILDMFDKTSNTILASLNKNNRSDVSMYRTPSGSYYCEQCNMGLEDIARLKMHISSKAHLAATKNANKCKG